MYQAPPPAYQAPPPVYQAPPPPAGPTAAQVRAAKRAAARIKAARRAARLRKQRREARRKREAAAAAKLVATRRAAESRKLEAGRREARTRAAWDAAPSESVERPIVAAATIAALLILGIALVPAYVVPWQRISVALDDHREHFAVVGGTTLLGATLLLALTFLGQ